MGHASICFLTAVFLVEARCSSTLTARGRVVSPIYVAFTSRKQLNLYTHFDVKAKGVLSFNEKNEDNLQDL